MSFFKSLFVASSPYENEIGQPFEDPMDEIKYNMAREEVSEELIEILSELYTKTESYAYLSEFESRENSWKKKEFWNFCFDNVSNIKQIFDEIQEDRFKMLSSGVFILPDDVIDDETMLMINKIMLGYSDLLKLLLQFEAHWQTSLHSYQLFSHKSLELSDYEKFQEFTKPQKPKTAWDSFGFVAAENYLMQKIYMRLEWISEHPVHENVLPIMVSDSETYVDSDDSEVSSLQETRKTCSVPNLGEQFSSTNEVHVDADADALEPVPHYSKSLPKMEIAVYKLDIETKEPETETVEPRVGSTVDPMTRKLSYRKIPLELCGPNCLCYHCYVMNSNNFESCSSSDELDTIVTGWNELKPKYKEKPASKYSDGNIHGQSSADEVDLAIKLKGLREEINKTVFDKQLKEFEEEIGRVGQNGPRNLLSRLLRNIAVHISRYWSRSTRSGSVNPEILIPIPEIQESESDIEAEQIIWENNLIPTETERKLQIASQLNDIVN